MLDFFLHLVGFVSLLDVFFFTISVFCDATKCPKEWGRGSTNLMEFDTQFIALSENSRLSTEPSAFSD